MYKVKKGYKSTLSCRGYLGCISEAPQKILEHLFHSGHPQIEKAPKAKKNKKIDNKEGEPLPKLDNE